MNILNKAMSAMKKNDHLSIIKNDSSQHKSSVDNNEQFTDIRPIQAKKKEEMKNFQSDTGLNEVSKHTEQEVIDISGLDIHELDINFNDLEDDPANTDGSILSINPINPFSNQIELDLNKLNSEGFITPKHANTLLSNTFRMIKRPILNNAMGKGASKVDHANMVMLTSSLPSEGKTFSAINLAMSIALEKNKHVLLIDADVNKPSHHDIFGLGKNRGLTDVLLSRVDDMSEVLYRTNIPSLTLMSAGHEYAHATELLASDNMKKFIHELSTRYPDRVVLFDSPPLLLTTEASELAAHMGQVIVVVEAEKTLNQEILKSVSLLHNEIVLLMLNKMREKNEIGSYGYYGYGHNNK